VFEVPSFPAADDALHRLDIALAWSPASEAFRTVLQDPALAAWLQDGLTIHEHRKSDTCLFCKNPLTNSRIAELSDTFDAHVRTVTADIAALKQGFEREHRTFGALRIQVPSHLFPEELAKAAQHLDQLERARAVGLEGLEQFVNAAAEKLRNPNSNPSTHVGREKLTQARDLWTVAVAALEALVTAHNDAIHSLDKERDAAKRCLEAHILHETVSRYRELNANSKAHDDTFNALTRQIRVLEEQLQRLTAALRNTALAAEQINRDLETYLGHGELKLVHKGEGYAVTRHGQPVDDLSEGEKTALALLYFLKSLQGADCMLADTIVVVDDPVSSLDAGAIFGAFGFIKNRTEAAKQLFVLTHDASLFRLAKGWLNQSPETKGCSELYLVRAEMVAGRKCSAIERLPALLRNYESEYQYLFSVIYSASQLPEGTSLERFMLLPNAARRFAEQFLSFRYGHMPFEKSGLLKALQSTGLPPESVTRLFRFLHTHSHEDVIAEPAMDVALFSEGPVILRDVVKLVETEDPRHFERLKAAALSANPSMRGNAGRPEPAA